MKSKVKYGIGQQSFEELRRAGCLYVDKTRYIEEILSSGMRYCFLGRPRRFGKSLFLSTLRCFFEGKRELFRGLHIDAMEWNWEPVPVIYLDFNRVSYSSKADDLEIFIDKFLGEQEARFGISASSSAVALRLEDIIKAAYLATGKGVVILVDEYDKPLVNNIHNAEQFDRNRALLSDLYSNLKSSADYLSLVFLTGVSQFGRLSIFSSLNNIKDLSFDDDYSAVCGITEPELIENFQEGIQGLSEYWDEPEEKILSRLKFHYDGYHFGRRCPDIYNPFSLLNVMQSKDFFCYWVQSGTPTLLAEMLKKEKSDLKNVFKCEASRKDLSTLDNTSPSIKALLYQTGYLTITGYDSEYDEFTLGLPNEEIKTGFLEFLLPYYAKIKEDEVSSVMKQLVKSFRNGEPDKAMTLLQTMFADYDNRLGFGKEENVRNAMLIVFDLIGLKVRAEYATSNGRIDLLVETGEYIYIIELKFDGSASDAVRQIEEKNYERPFKLDGRRLFRIGVNFSSQERTLSEWIIK